ncbi:XRE family transcriptional regulator [Actinomadura fibrosa]|uniref:XRE family transcriptional regulator n=1 Tax=Actinomadura fibrosa TaxID=111802 RepID=A0ABW2XAE2_9ACTN|nr:XRE family transcriptional regulator [Actinomadura fibrosa]
MRRRAAIQFLAALSAGVAVPPGTLETVLSGIDDAIGRPVDLAEWEAIVHEYGHLITSRPPGTLVGDITADIVAVGRLLKVHEATDDVPGLLRVSAGLSGLLAIDLGYVGRRHEARTAWRTAQRAADASGDRELQVWVRGRAAQDAHWTGRPDHVVIGLADEAIEIADGAPSGGKARAHAARASVAADQGDADGAKRSLVALKDTFDRLPDDDAGLSELTFRETQLRWNESYAHTQIGDRRAEATLDDALALYSASATRPRANLQLMRAALLVKSHDVDTGLHHALTTMQAHHRPHSAATGMLVNRVLHALPKEARTNPDAQELRELAANRTALA